MTSTVCALSQLSSPENLEINVKIIDGTLDKLVRDAVDLKSRGNKPKQTRKKRMSKMGTTSTSPTANEPKVKNYVVGVPQTKQPNTDAVKLVPPDEVKDGEKSKFVFKIRDNGDYQVSKKVFDLTEMEKLTKYNTFSVKAIKDYSDVEAMDREHVLALVNLGLQKQQLIEAKKAIGGGNTKKITDFINNFRNLPQFANMVSDKLEGEAKTNARAAQAKAILTFVKPIKPLWDQLELLLAEEDEDSEEEESTESNASDKD